MTSFAPPEDAFKFAECRRCREPVESELLDAEQRCPSCVEQIERDRVARLERQARRRPRLVVAPPPSDQPELERTPFEGDLALYLAGGDPKKATEVARRLAYAADRARHRRRP